MSKRCYTCRGSGTLISKEKVSGNCPGCGGTGKNPFTKDRNCTECKGSGKKTLAISSKCVTCNGTGEIE